MTEQLERDFQQGTEEFDHRLRSAVAVGDLEAVFLEVALMREHVAKDLKKAWLDERTTLSEQDIIERHAERNAVIDLMLRAAVEELLERRARAMAQAAQLDSLTGLLNRAAFDDHLRSEMTRAKRYQRQFSLVLLDIDCLKPVNDEYGHLAGDEVLKNVGRILHTSLRRSDVVFRYGGDEFAAICPETSGAMIDLVFRRVERKIQDWAGESRFARQIGVSWGLSSYPDQERGSEVEETELIRIADERLYLCKKAHHKQRKAQP